MKTEHVSFEARGITRRWPGGNPVFSGLSISVPGNTICVLLGPSGCGKSTFLRCAASLDPIESGQIYINGEPVSSPSPRRQLILQDDNQLLPWLNVEDNISFPVRMGRSGRTSGYSGASLLRMVGMTSTGSLYPAQLSGGMRQRAVLARALAADPEILLLDEPFAALDSEIRRRLHMVIRQIYLEQKLTVLLVTHDVSEALVLADNIVYMNSRGEVSTPKPNPLGADRDTESMAFFREMNHMRRHYESLIDSVDL